MAKWKKKNNYGDYRDPEQNHKYDGCIKVIDKGDRKGETIIVPSRVDNILSQARYYYGKHIGSKKLDNILRFIKKAAIVRTKVKELVSKQKESSLVADATNE